MTTDRMIINGREILLARCTKCNVLENINLLDGKDDGSGDFNLLECIRCYGPDWLPTSECDIRYSAQQSYADDYERWDETKPA